ncbi:hypothetical protein D9757_000225 [Collybiopsis confluens]|uniref:Uncharacterized protein n=1 Tax=Collybiopsis confluens TaxID=2823264 RepID=A0A8H5MHA5_9AGAR|nr:hypothetical protein D9757_000225 [Collybiopsis confluens]
MHALRQLKNSLFGSGLSLEDLETQLDNVSVPYSEVDCRTCPNPCDEGHESYPNKFNVDMDSVMFGSIVISTGKMDWEREITSAKNSLAAHVQHVAHSAPLSSSPPAADSELKSKRGIHVPGIFDSDDVNRLSILNGSHHTLSDDPDHETVLVFPDYKLITEVPRSLDGARALWDTALSPTVPALPASDEKRSLNSWIIPYSCVILLCSHKRRDNRCHVAAAQLGQAFTRSLEEHGWTVDTEIEHPSHCMGSPLEELTGTDEENEEAVTRQLQEIASEKKALILRNSHIGGHRYAGNCIVSVSSLFSIVPVHSGFGSGTSKVRVTWGTLSQYLGQLQTKEHDPSSAIYTPQGAGVWYGRVSTHEVESIVSQTLEEGLILPPLLRGGMNISRPGCKSLHDW